MRSTPVLLLVASLAFFGCQTPVALGNGHPPIVDQRAIADIACGPSAMFNWMSHGGSELQGVLATVSTDRTPVQTVRHIIDTYGKRQSATNPSVTRYGRHNGGVGSVNLMLMAKELLADHLPSPPALRGEYLQRLEGESTEGHLTRITDWFTASIDSGIPVILYLRGYQRTTGGHPRNLFGHHVVVTSLDEESASGEASRFRLTLVDSASGRVERAELLVADRDFTAPTFTYRFEDDRALTQENVQTGRPLLEIRIPSYRSSYPPKSKIIVAHFATFAQGGA